MVDHWIQNPDHPIVRLKQMRVPTIIVISLASLAAGYFLRFAQQANKESGVAKPEIGATSYGTEPGEQIYELGEVRESRERLDGQTITVVGAVCFMKGWPFLVSDDKETLLTDISEKGGYRLSLPEWRFGEIKNVYPRIAITGKFAKLDDHVGFDGLGSIESISWRSDLPSGKVEKLMPPDESVETTR